MCGVFHGLLTNRSWSRCGATDGNSFGTEGQDEVKDVTLAISAASLTAIYSAAKPAFEPTLVAAFILTSRQDCPTANPCRSSQASPAASCLVSHLVSHLASHPTSPAVNPHCSSRASLVSSHQTSHLVRQACSH